jgi:hypothetical protein
MTQRRHPKQVAFDSHELSMTLEGITFVGGPTEDAQLLEELPRELAMVLRHTNGFVATRGAFHLRGASFTPAWHSIRVAWRGPHALAERYRTVHEADVPFAEDALGDQYLLREGEVWRLDAESDRMELSAPSLHYFLEAVSDDPVCFLNLGPLLEFWDQGGHLEPGQLLSVHPPLLVNYEGNYSYRAVSTGDRLGALAAFAAQVRDLPDGAAIEIALQPPAV